jgi:DHA1 family inner membrane transport protein
VLIPAAPKTRGHAQPGMAAEIRAAFRLPVLTSFLMITLGMIAFFTPFTFIVPILTEVTGLSTSLVPVLLFVAGIGGVFGNFLGGRLGDWKPLPAMVAILAVEVVLYLAALPAAYNAIAMGVVLLLWSLVGFAFSAPVQARILNAAHDAPNLVSTLISTAYNVGIAAGAWLGGVALNAGWHYARLPAISALFVAIALVLALLSWAFDRRGAARQPDSSAT